MNIIISKTANIEVKKQDHFDAVKNFGYATGEHTACITMDQIREHVEEGLGDIYITKELIRMNMFKEALEAIKDDPDVTDIHFEI